MILPLTSVHDSLRIADFEATSQPWTHVVEELIRAFKYYGARSVSSRKISRLDPLDPRPIVATVMGVDDAKRLRIYQGQPLILICWDVWEPDWDAWLKEFRQHNVVAIFVSNTRVKQFIEDQCKAIPVHFFSEAIDLDHFPPRTPLLRHRTIDLLEYGRRYDEWHTEIVHGTKTGTIKGPFRHLYSGQKREELRQDVFPSRNSLVKGLLDCKLSACFPRSQTAPESTGSVVALTPRYLEAFAAGTLVIGTTPPDLALLHPDLAVIEVEPGSVAKQVGDLIKEISNLQKIADRNQSIVRKVGGWDVRAAEIIRTITQLVL